MARVKGAMMARKRRNKTLKLDKAFCNLIKLFGISGQFKELQIISKFMQSPIPQAALK